MGTVRILDETTVNPISLIGEMSGCCWGSDTQNYEKNYNRGLDCIRSNHGRTLEFPQIYLEIDGYSARFIREFTRHIGGAPTYLQESTRYIDYTNFNYFIPPLIQNNVEAFKIYTDCMLNTQKALKKLSDLGIPREDNANLLPLGMSTKIIFRTNLRMLVDMAKVRKCNRAYHEFRNFFKDFESELSNYSKEWYFLIKEEKIFKKRCEELGHCPEKHSCGGFKNVIN